jgi:hypothetical protein
LAWGQGASQAAALAAALANLSGPANYGYGNFKRMDRSLGGVYTSTIYRQALLFSLSGLPDDGNWLFSGNGLLTNYYWSWCRRNSVNTNGNTLAVGVYEASSHSGYPSAATAFNAAPGTLIGTGTYTNLSTRGTTEVNYTASLSGIRPPAGSSLYLVLTGANDGNGATDRAVFTTNPNADTFHDTIFSSGFTGDEFTIRLAYSDIVETEPPFASWPRDLPRNNLTAISAPAVTDDENDGYSRGSLWQVNT